MVQNRMLDEFLGILKRARELGAVRHIDERHRERVDISKIEQMEMQGIAQSFGELICGDMLHGKNEFVDVSRNMRRSPDGSHWKDGDIQELRARTAVMNPNDLTTLYQIYNRLRSEDVLKESQERLTARYKRLQYLAEVCVDVLDTLEHVTDEIFEYDGTDCEVGCLNEDLKNALEDLK